MTVFESTPLLPASLPIENQFTGWFNADFVSRVVSGSVADRSPFHPSSASNRSDRLLISSAAMNRSTSSFRTAIQSVDTNLEAYSRSHRLPRRKHVCAALEGSMPLPAALLHSPAPLKVLH